MDLLSIYKEYKELNEEYSKFIENLIEVNLDEEHCSEKLKDYGEQIENLKVKTDEIESEDKDKDNLRDLKYLIVDLLFLSVDLIAFDNYKEIERFKMRGTNYLNKKRRTEMFK